MHKQKVRKGEIEQRSVQTTILKTKSIQVPTSRPSAGRDGVDRREKGVKWEDDDAFSRGMVYNPVFGRGAASMGEKEEVDPKRAYVKKCFDLCDTNGDGDISFDEFVTGLRHFGRSLTQEQAKEAWQKVDTDNSGDVSFEEFEEGIGDWLYARVSQSRSMQRMPGMSEGSPSPSLASASISGGRESMENARSPTSSFGQKEPSSASSVEALTVDDESSSDEVDEMEELERLQQHRAKRRLMSLRYHKSGRVLKTGQLEKKGGGKGSQRNWSKGGRRNWKTRWFVLREDKLFYFESKETDQDDPLGMIKLGAASVGEFTDKRYGFVIRTPDRDLHVIAATGEEAEEWVNWIEYAIFMTKEREEGVDT